jgi:SAM-dependent methyltransferase/uncharacterized protein YbaR (Trm112 family)
MNSHTIENRRQDDCRRFYYRCLQCHNNLDVIGSDGLNCDVCGAAYPSIEGVKVLVSDPTRVLESCVKRLSEARERAAVSKAKLAAINDERYSKKAISLATEGYDGQLENLKLIERAVNPVREYLSSQSRQNSWFSQLSPVEVGWSSLSMIGYFYRDWGNTEEARFVTTLFTDAIKEHCGTDGKNVAVLGCGACRLVYDVAELFAGVCGLDLSIDTLLLAKLLLDGESPTVHFSFPHNRLPIFQQAVGLNGAAQKRCSIELVSADVTKLPFTNSSVTCVLTPYLLDIVHDSSAVVAEIHRVLAPNGIWINFSNFNQFGDPSDDESVKGLHFLDLPSYIHQSGFTLLSSAMRRYSHVNLSVISDWAHTTTETPTFFVAEKKVSPGSERRDYFAEYFAGKEAAIWQAIPRLSRPIALRQEKVFTGHSVQERKMVEILSVNASRAVDNEHALAVEWLLCNIDGRRTTGEIVDFLRKESGGKVEVGELIRFFRQLQESGIIKFVFNE